MAKYQTDFFRETEIQQVLKLLNQKSLVVVLGEEGRGKTTFLREAYEYTRLFNIMSQWFDCHNIYRALTHKRSVESVKRSYTYIVDWTKNLPPNQPLKDQPILFIDAGDWLFLTHGFVTAPLPFYKSEEWNKWMRLKEKSPKKWVEYILQTKFENVLKVEITGQLISSYEADVETYLAQEAVLQAIEDLILQKKGRIILTDHNLPREHITPSPYLLQKYENIISRGTGYELPASYEVEKARLFIKKKYQIMDKELQDAIITETQAKHSFLKLALNEEVAEKLKQLKSQADWKRVLQEAINKIQPE